MQMGIPMKGQQIKSNDPGISMSAAQMEINLFMLKIWSICRYL